jgi:hypothetical protein
VLALYLAGLGYAAAQPPAPAQDATLASWLRAHHLTAGLSGYHQANIVTLESGGAVTLRPVRAVAGRLAAYAWNANSEWFDQAAAGPTFLVLTRPGAPGSSGLTVREAVATFGPPARGYTDGAFLVLVWPEGSLRAALRLRYCCRHVLYRCSHQAVDTLRRQFGSPGPVHWPFTVGPWSFRYCRVDSSARRVSTHGTHSLLI